MAIGVGAGCISLYSYIKPQLALSGVFLGLAVYPYIPTSNRNSCTSLLRATQAVYPYIPTSNRNLLTGLMAALRLYILIFLHQTATSLLLFL